jgi:hypothetical protein
MLNRMKKPKHNCKVLVLHVGGAHLDSGREPIILIRFSGFGSVSWSKWLICTVAYSIKCTHTQAHSYVAEDNI